MPVSKDPSWIEKLLGERLTDPIIGPYLSMLLLWNWKAVYLLLTMRSETGLVKAIAWSTHDPIRSWTCGGVLHAIGWPAVFLALYWLYLAKAQPHVVAFRTRVDETAKGRKAMEQAQGHVPITQVALDDLSRRANALPQAHTLIVDLKRATAPYNTGSRSPYAIVPGAANLSGFVRCDGSRIYPMSGPSHGDPAYVIAVLGANQYLVGMFGALERGDRIEHAGQSVGLGGSTLPPGKVDTAVAGWIPSEADSSRYLFVGPQTLMERANGVPWGGVIKNIPSLD